MEKCLEGHYDCKISNKLKGKFYRITIRPVILYGSECCGFERSTRAKSGGDRDENVEMDEWTYKKG